jgi:hypothetical protein
MVQLDKRVLSKSKTKLLERVFETPAGKARPGGDPVGAKAPRRLPDRPRKASACSGNQRSNYTIP